MIPKTIHYCWFGRGEKSKLIQKCIRSWKKYCPDYTIIEWNEDNYDITLAPDYVRHAYEAKKWAFVTDYVRLKVIYENGGIYLDTDVELIKPIDHLLKYRAYFGFEEGKTVNTGLGFGAEKGTPILLEMMREYEALTFNLEMIKHFACGMLDTPVLCRRGLIINNEMQLLDGEILILPIDYLSPKSLLTERIKITPNTLSIHHFASSLFTKEMQESHKRSVWQARRAERRSYLRSLPNRVMLKILGEKRYARFRDEIKSRIQRRSK